MVFWVKNVSIPAQKANHHTAATPLFFKVTKNAFQYVANGFIFWKIDDDFLFNFLEEEEGELGLRFHLVVNV